MPENIFTVKDLTSLVKPKNVKIIGDDKRRVWGVRSIDDACFGDLTFCKTGLAKNILHIKESRASVIICKKGIELPPLKDKTLIMVENPKLYFIRCSNIFFPREKSMGIHPTVIIGEDCNISDDVYIGAYSVIGDGVTIGRNVVIKPGCVIGSDGFGYVKNEVGAYEKFQHFGSVIIEDNVEIGANTCIDRGTLSNTVIGKGTKIDNLVHIGHNAQIGKNCIITAKCMLGRSTIGDGTWIGPSSSILPGVNIGKGAFIGLGSVVVRDVEDYMLVYGVPAKQKRKVYIEEPTTI